MFQSFRKQPIKTQIVISVEIHNYFIYHILKKYNSGIQMKSFKFKIIILFLCSFENISSSEIKMIAPQEWKGLVIKEAKELDLAIESFKATGDYLFLIKVLEAINQNDKALLLGYEFNNRRYLNQLSNSKTFNYDDLWEEIGREEKHFPGFKQKVMLAGAGIWGLEILLHQDGHLTHHLNAIYKENPNLDYWKKIHRAIK